MIADDHPVVLEGLESLVRPDPELRVVARCVNGEEAIEAVRKFHPDLLISDLNMPRRDGMAVVRALGDEGLATRVILLVAEINKQQALEATRLGVGGILLKELAPQMLIRCIYKVHSGARWFEKGTLDSVIENLLTRDAASRDVTSILTRRELEVLAWVTRGMRNREVGDRLDITEGSVKLHLHNIYRKLNIQSRMELMVYAQRNGLADV